MRGARQLDLLERHRPLGLGVAEAQHRRHRRRRPPGPRRGPAARPRSPSPSACGGGAARRWPCIESMRRASVPTSTHELLTTALVWVQARGRPWAPSTSLRAGRTAMPYFHFCLNCRERLYSTSRMTIDHRCAAVRRPADALPPRACARVRRAGSAGAPTPRWPTSTTATRAASPHPSATSGCGGATATASLCIARRGSRTPASSTSCAPTTARTAAAASRCSPARATGRGWPASLSGWRDVCGERDSLAWLRRQLGSLGPPAGGAAASA